MQVRETPRRPRHPVLHRRARYSAIRFRKQAPHSSPSTLHLLKDESTPELIDSVVSNKPVTGFSGSMSQRVAREGYQHIHFYDPQNAKKRGVTLKLPVSTMKNIEDNIFSASKIVKGMRFKCNLRPDPLEGQEPCPDDWEGFFIATTTTELHQSSTSTFHPRMMVMY